MSCSTTWCESVRPSTIALTGFVSSSEYAFRRTTLNNFMKDFLNSRISDPLIYLEKSQPAILSSVRESFCWMTQFDWDDYADFTDQSRDLYSLT